MNRNEAANLIRIMQVNYPDTFREMSDEALVAMINLWAEMFPEPYLVVAAAVKKFMLTSKEKFMPNIGMIKDMMISEQATLDESAAWDLVRKAVSNSGYHAAEEFNKLPQEIKDVVHSPSQLRDWALMDSGAFNSVVMSNFQRAYKTIQKRRTEDLKIPENVRNVLSGLSEQLRLGE